MPLLLVKSALATTIPMPPCGINPAPEWALDRAGLPREDGPAYTYPDTHTPVRLYLIDTSVANSSNWIGANPNLTIEKSELVRSTNDPQTFSTDHGTKMLSLIGDVETGIAPGTPIHVVNYDVFPTAESTNLTLLSSAVYKAISDAENNPVPMRSVICIATSTSVIASSTSLKYFVGNAVAKGIPVVVSAGNLGKEIPATGDSYIPAAYGAQNGVICVGASCAEDTLIPMSNFGTAVDLLAPGNAVRVRNDQEAVPFTTMTGTSPATALVAGAVLTELSINPSLTPAEVEERLKTAAITPPIPTPLPVLRATVAASLAIDIAEGILISPEHPALLGCDPAIFEGAGDPSMEDLDNNGIPDILDLLFGFNTANPPVPSTLQPVTGPAGEYRFPISKDLLDAATPFTLKNGYQWRIQCSHNLIDWQTPEGSLTQETDASGRLWLTATFPYPPTTCYVRIQVVEPQQN